MFDYASLKFIWWLLIGVLLIGFAIMDGHDMGVGTLLPFLGKNDSERRVIINSVGAHWEGNQVWFVTGGGAIFAAWPMIYATAFSGLYWAMMAALWAMFFRPVGFKYRSMVASPSWRNSWDWGIFIGSFVPPIIFGVAFGNLLQGLPFGFDNYLRPSYSGSFWALLNPFALWTGLLSLLLMLLQGAVYLAHRTVGDIQARAQKAAFYSGLGVALVFIGAGLWLKFGSISGYRISSAIDPAALPNPLAKTVVRDPLAWWQNYARWPALYVLPALGIGGALLAAWLSKAGRYLSAFVLSSLAIVGVISTAGAAMFPFMLPSSSQPQASLTVWDSSSSHLTLGIMLVVTAIFIPLIVVYTSWAYRVMRGKITVSDVEANSHTAY